MSILTFLILGLVAGWLGSVIMKTNESQGMLADVIVGMLGAVIGGMLFNFFGAPGVTGLNIYSVIVATIGAAVLLAIRYSLRAR